MAAEFWSGKFGDEYTERNQGPALHAANLRMFSHILSRIRVNSVLELGANRGMNIRAINELLPYVKTCGVECNESAWMELKKVCTKASYLGDVTDSSLNLLRCDLVFTKGLLIHIPPEKLAGVYALMYNTSKRYIMVAEYHNPTPVEVQYRGKFGMMWKRDFAGELMSKYPLKLVDYGFLYHGGSFPQDDITWFLMDKE